jgi:cysteinyl-tRNA synthetase
MALAVIDGLADIDIQSTDHAVLTDYLTAVNEILGINLLRPDITGEQKQLISQREQARVDKDWKTSDELRDTLLKQHIVIKDTPDGTIWSRT